MAAESEEDLPKVENTTTESSPDAMDKDLRGSPPSAAAKEEQSSPVFDAMPAEPSTPPTNEDGAASVAPIMTNAIPARPPSSTSVHSASSSGPRSTTATSRRGGRTRSRSPPMMMSNRPPSTGPQLEPFASNDDRRVPLPSGANPSAAAAAAAAAAKSISRNPPPPPSWYDSQDPRAREYRRSRGEAPRYHPRYYEGNAPARPRWSPEEEETGRPPSQNRYLPPRRPIPEEHYGYREDYASYRSRGGRGEPYAPQAYDKEYERRYADPRYDERRQHTAPSVPPHYDYRLRDASRVPHRDDPYYAQGKESDSARPTASAPVALTTRVIGGPTPIHLPRAPDIPSPRRPRSESQSDSIFRGRPRSEAHNPPPIGEEDNAQVLMSLRTPSSSFEEKPSKGAMKREDMYSPEAPPQIHHSHHQSDSLFDPQRSPKGNIGPPQPSSSIDMAPSFNLFNQSFDSIGDTANFFNVGGPLETALRSTSFGVGPTSSKDETTELHLSSSVGNFSHQLLGGPTFEMSPNNSFGNGAPMLRTRSGNMMVLGDPEIAGSPSQVLEGYGSRSYGIADPDHRSISVPTLSNAYGPGPAHYRTYSHPETIDGAPGFYMFLKRHKGAFSDCSFLLPGLKAALLQAPDGKDQSSSDGTPKRHNQYGEPNPHDIAIARRRVISAVCAFGGTFQGDRSSQQPTKSNATTSGSSSQSIFRGKPGDTAATVTPNSWASSNSPSGHRSRHRAKYDEVLPSRYYENDNRLSWEFEEIPPIDEMGRDEEEAEAYDDVKREGNSNETMQLKEENAKEEYEDEDETEDGKKTPTGSKDGDQPKMRYRCKLCGQPKQNHTCPYQQSLARSIGIMIYPAVNAFTAAEPGSLAPALSEMNNFISSGDSVASNEGSPSHASRMMNAGGISIQHVTPESMRSSPRVGTSPITTPVRSSARTPTRHNPRPLYDMQRQYLGGPPSSASRGTKRGHGQLTADNVTDQGELLFVAALELKPEQFRIVTTSKIVNAPDAFTYPALPLPYAQRKRLSDNLFSLSKEVPQLTDECAAVLREAREKDMWDLAVAELMTQVVVVAHCHDTDSQFEGLRRYLMTLGISC